MLYRFLFLNLCFVCCLACGNAGPEGATPPTPTLETEVLTPTPELPQAPIERIRALYNTTVKALDDKKLQKEVLLFECDEGPFLGETRYYANDQGDLVLVEHTFSAGDHGGTTQQYFLDGDALYFYFEDQSYWTFAQDGKTTIDHSKELRYYVADGQLIRCLEKKWKVEEGKKLAPTAIQNQAIECPELATLEEALEALKVRRSGANNTTPLALCD